MLISGGNVECWGDDFSDQLGNGESETLVVDSPQKTQHVSGVSDVGMGGAHTCVVEAGHVHCWGENHAGELGDGVIGEYRKVEFEPQEALGVTTAVEVDAGESFTCARLSSGHAECWGSDDRGELGTGEGKLGAPEKATPQAVIDLTEATQLEARVTTRAPLRGMVAWFAGRQRKRAGR